jgi:hypothetical protein
MNINPAQASDKEVNALRLVIRARLQSCRKRPKKTPGFSPGGIL